MPIFNVKAIVKVKWTKVGDKEVKKDKIKLKRDIEVSQEEIDKVGFMPALRTAIKDEAKRIAHVAGYEVKHASIEYNMWRSVE